MVDNIPKKDFFYTGGTKLRTQEIKGVIRQGNQSLLIPFESLKNPPDGGSQWVSPGYNGVSLST